VLGGENNWQFLETLPKIAAVKHRARLLVKFGE